MKFTNIIGIKLIGHRLTMNTQDLTSGLEREVLIDTYAGVTSWGAPIAFTEDEVQLKTTWMKSQVGDFIEHFQDFRIEYVKITTSEENLRSIELTARNDGVEA